MAAAQHKPLRFGRFLARLILALALSFALAVEPVMAESVLRDAETESFFRDMAAPLVAAAGLRPGNVQVVLVQSNDINAFVAGGQTIYIYSATIEAADSANEIQGIVAHELGHIAGGHVINQARGTQVATGISLLSLVLGVAAMALGAGEAGAGVLAAGQQAAMGKFLAFSRLQESSADQAGAAYLKAAGITGKGSLSFFKKLQNMEFRLAMPQDDSFATDHPLTADRIEDLQALYQASPAWNKPPDPKLEERFQRIKAKLAGFLSDPQQILNRYPESDATIPARYARAYAWHKSAFPDKAVGEVDSLLRDRPHDPFFLELKGQILLESGKPREALDTLRDAVAHAPDQPLISALLGHALIATEDPANFPEAKAVLRAAVARDNSNPFAWYQLGMVYEHDGDEARAALATAERYSLEGNAMMALSSAQIAMGGIKPGTPDCLRATDIAMASRGLIEQDRDHSDAKKLEKADKWHAPTTVCGGETG